MNENLVPDLLDLRIAMVGPGLSGKLTNLRWLYEKFAPDGYAVAGAVASIRERQPLFGLRIQPEAMSLRSWRPMLAASPRSRRDLG